MSVRRNDYERTKLAPACAPSPLRPVSRPDVATETMYTNQNGIHRQPFRSRVSEAKTESHNVSVVDAVFREMGHSIGSPSASMPCGGLLCGETTCEESPGDHECAKSLYFFTDLEGGERGLELLDHLPAGAKFVHLGDSTDIGSISTTVIHKLNEMKQLRHATNLIGNRDLNKVLFNSTVFYGVGDGKYDVPELLVKNGGVPLGMYDKFHAFIKSQLHKIMGGNEPRRLAFLKEAELATILLVTAMHRWTRGTDRYWTNAKNATTSVLDNKNDWRSVSTSTRKNNPKMNSRMDVIDKYLDDWETMDYITTNPDDNALLQDILLWKTELDEYVSNSEIIYHNKELGVVGVHNWFGVNATLLTNKNTFLNLPQIQGIQSVSTFQCEYANKDFSVKDLIPRIRWNRMASTTNFGEWCSEVNRSAEALIRFESNTSSDSCCVAACRRYLLDVSDAPSESFMHGQRPANYINALDDASRELDLPKFVLVGHQPTFVGRMGRFGTSVKTHHLVEIDTQYTPYSRSVAHVKKKTVTNVMWDVKARDKQLKELQDYTKLLFPGSTKDKIFKVNTWSLGNVTFQEEGEAETCTRGVLCANYKFDSCLLTYKIASGGYGHSNGQDGTVCTLASLLFLQESTDVPKGAPNGVKVWNPLNMKTGPDLPPSDITMLDNEWSKQAKVLMEKLQGEYLPTGVMHNISNESTSTRFWTLMSYSHSCDLSVNNYAK